MTGQNMLGWLALAVSTAGCGAVNDVVGVSGTAGSSAGGGTAGAGGAGGEGGLFGGGLAGGDPGAVPTCAEAAEQKSSVGCDYYAVIPDSVTDTTGSCFAVYIANTLPVPANITVERGGQLFDVATFGHIPAGIGESITYAPLTDGVLPPGEVAILFLGSHPGEIADDTYFTPCPAGIEPAITGDAGQHGTTLGQAFHITTSSPVSSYSIYPYGGGITQFAGATLLLPTSVWDTNYVAVDSTSIDVGSPSSGMPSMSIVAKEDDTTITFNPTATIAGGAGIPAAPAGQPQTYTLSKGQILQITQPASLSGSAVQSDKPIGLWGGATCVNTSVDKGFSCDVDLDQIPPVKALGHEYVAVRYRARYDSHDESAIWRVIGAVAGTQLTWEPAPPPGAPTSLEVGQVVELRAPGPFVVRSQGESHPFYMSSQMTTFLDALGPNGDPFGDARGDPEVVNVIPPQQYLTSYVFFTDPTYPETNLVLVRDGSPGAFEDVELDCAGAIQGWQPLGASGLYEYARVDLVRHDFDPQDGCSNGRHAIKSNGRFGLTVWGWGSGDSAEWSQATSYGYPAGASVVPVNDVIVPAK